MVLPHQYLCGEIQDPLLLHMDKQPPGTTHPTHILLGGSVSFPSLGGIFSSIPHASPSDQSLFSSDDIYTSVQDSACTNTSLNTSNTNTPTLPLIFNTSISSSSSTYTPSHYTGCPCADCVKNMLINTIIPLLLIYLASPLIIMHDYFI